MSYFTFFFLDPTIRWYRNNEPLKKSKFFTVTQANGEAVFRISECYQEDVAEYKVEAVNPAGKATSIANLVLARKYPISIAVWTM